MKKTIALLLALFFVIGLCGCSEKSQNDALSVSLEDQYYHFAQECVQTGDKENAIAALEEGIDKTGSKKLKELLESIKSGNNGNPSNGDADASTGTTTFEASPESTKFKIPDKLLKVFQFTREQLFGSKPYDFTTQGNECYYSDDQSFIVYYYLDGLPSEKTNVIQGEIQSLIPGKSIYTADEIQNVFSGYRCDKYYLEMDNTYRISVEYENYTITFSANEMNNYTTFTLSRL